MQHETQLLKGVLTPLILSLLDDRESYGYQLVNEIRGTGLRAFAEGSIYPALNRLEREGYVASRLVSSDKGPARKYYTTTHRGKDLLRDQLRAWQSLVRAVQPYLGPVLDEGAGPPQRGTSGERADKEPRDG